MSETSVGCFGKLPIQGDFLRLNAAGSEVAELDQWVQEGLHTAKSKLGNRWEETFAASDPWQFVYTAEKADRFLVGVSIPSRDQSGRRYPLFLFLRVDRSRLPCPVYFAPMLFSSFWPAARELGRNGWAGLDGKTFLSRVERLPVAPGDAATVRTDFARRLESRSAPEFWTDLFGEARRDRLGALGRNLRGLTASLRATAGAKVGFGFTVPLSRDDDHEGDDIPFWCELLGRAARRDLGDPILLWSRRPAKGHPTLWVSYRRPGPKTVLALIGAPVDDESWYDLAPERRASEGAVFLGDESRDRAPAEDEGSVAAFLRSVETLT